MSDNGTSRSAPRRGALLWLVGGDRAYEGYKERGSAGASFFIDLIDGNLLISPRKCL